MYQEFFKFNYKHTNYPISFKVIKRLTKVKCKDDKTVHEKTLSIIIIREMQIKTIMIIHHL